MPAEPAAPPPAATVEHLAHQLPGLRFVVGGSAIALGIAALHYGKELLAPLLLAALLAFVLMPAVTALRRWLRLPLPAAVAVAMAGAITLCGILGMVIGQQVVALSHDLPSYQDTVRAKLRALRPTATHGPWQDSMKLLGMVEGELDAARRALATAPRTDTIQRVQVEPTPLTPLQSIALIAKPVFLPLAQAGLVLVLLFFMLLQRNEIRDRLMRLMGQDLGASADALDEAGGRVSRYLVTQLLVNTSYAVPLALGLWAIGVPGAWLWGMLGGVLRFVPYLGAVVGAACPMLIAFAVDPGWQMVAMTLGLILALEAVMNNIIEPMAYARSTGVSSMAVLLSAGFWSLVWGPVGLVIATPLTTCLLVLGRHLGPLSILDPLLGREPVFDPPTRLHQRLLSGDVEEALEQAQDADTPAGLLAFYDDAALGTLRRVAEPTGQPSGSPRRARVVEGMARLLDALEAEGPPRDAEGPLVLCIGARNDVDDLSARMLTHVLQTRGVNAQLLTAKALTTDHIAALALNDSCAVCLCTFNPTPLTHTSFVLRRLRRHQPDLTVLLAAWSRPNNMDDVVPLAELGGVLPVNGIRQACEQVAECVSSYSDARPEPSLRPVAAA